MGCMDTDKCCRPRDDNLAHIKKNRSCTDILMFLVMVVGYLAALYAVFSARSAGANPKRIIKAVDMQANICGEGNLTDKPFGVWPHLGHLTVMQCVADCNETLNPDSTVMAQLYASKNIAFRCFPDFNAIGDQNVTAMPTTVDIFASSFTDVWDFASHAVAELEMTWYLILTCGWASCVIASVILVIYRYCAGVMVWAIILSVFVVGVTLGAMLYGFLGFDGVDTSSIDLDATTQAYLAYTAWGISAVYLLVIFALRTQIKIAIQIVKEGATALIDMPQIVLFPIIPAIMLSIYLLLWMGAALNIYSVVTYTTAPSPDAVLTYADPNFLLKNGQKNGNPAIMEHAEHATQWQDWMGYMVFHALWQTQSLYYWGYLVLAGTVSDWYFTPWKNGKKHRGSADDELGRFPVMRAICRTAYHFGSVQFAGLLLAIIKFIRYMIIYIEKTSNVKDPSGIQKAVLCAITCCLKCVECCLDKLNKNGLIWQAIYGDNFCISSCSAFGLLFRNLLRVAAVNYVSTIIIFSGRLFTAITATVIAVYAMENVSPWKDEVLTYYFPASIVFIFGYIVSGSVFLSLSAIIDTEFLCFLVDSEVNGDSMVASKQLQQIIGRYKKQSEKEGKEHHEKVASRRNLLQDTFPDKDTEMSVAGGKENVKVRI